jgi:hypothetical protein
MGKISITKAEELKQHMINQIGDSGKMNIIESSELGDSLKELNDDKTDQTTKMSGIDLRTRLAFTEVSAILALDTLVAFKFVPERCLIFTRQKKRLAVSLAGKGRQEIVDIVAGKKEQDRKQGILGRIFNPHQKEA